MLERYYGANSDKNFAKNVFGNLIEKSDNKFCLYSYYRYAFHI